MCGIVGIHGAKDASLEAYQGLLLLQHRGQDAAGILSFEKESREFHLYKEKGLVGQVFDQKNLSQLSGQMALGHTRYSTIAGKSSQGPRDLQPMLVNYPHGLGLVHNGNVVNMDEITELLREKHHRIMLTKNDAETLLNVLSTEIQDSLQKDPITQLKLASEKIFDEAMGGYAIIGLWANGYMFALRDPHGIRPLVLGKKIQKSGETSYIFASETNVLAYLNYDFVRDVGPGELIAIDEKGQLHSSVSDKAQVKSPCMFEWVYFSTPESVMDGSPVYEARLKLGMELGEKINRLRKDNLLDADVVVPVPESGRIAAISLSETTGIPYRELLIKNRYIQRSFILQDQESRKQAVQLKLMPVSLGLKGKKVIVVDDSIVRGTTSKRLVEMVREAGAKEVHFVSTCPPIKYPCYFGIDFPLKEELIAAQLDEKELAHVLGADSVIYQDLTGIEKSCGQSSLCTGCLTGNYPFDLKNAGTHFVSQRQAFL